MFAATLRRLSVSPFALFIKEQKHNSALVGLPIARRGRMLGRLYRGLSPRDRAALQKRAAAHPRFKRRKAKVPRGKSRYNRFVKTHYHDKGMSKLPPNARMKAIAAKWRAKNGLPEPVKAKKAGSRKPAKASRKTAKRKVKTVAASARKGSKKVAVKKVSPKRLKSMIKSKKVRKASPKVAKALKAQKPRKGSKAKASAAANKKKSRRATKTRRA